MDWQATLRRRAIFHGFADFDHVYDVAIEPAIPPEYDVPGLVGLTFRLRARPRGGHVYVTALRLPAVLGLGERMGLEPGEALAQVDSHERLHIALQLEGVPEQVEEQQLRFADAVVLSLRHPELAEHLKAGDFGLVTRVEPGFWEALIDAGEVARQRSH